MCRFLQLHGEKIVHSRHAHDLPIGDLKREFPDFSHSLCSVPLIPIFELQLIIQDPIRIVVTHLMKAHRSPQIAVARLTGDRVAPFAPAGK